MQDKTGVDQKVSDAELIVLLRKVQEEIQGHSELNELNLLLHDFAKELLRQRLLLRVEFVQMMRLSRLGLEDTHTKKEVAADYLTSSRPSLAEGLPYPDRS